eukprot:557279-Prymnesium_polylepis.1
MATPHHRTSPLRCGAVETASEARAAPSHPAPATPAPDSSTNLHAAACAVLCGGHQELAHSSWRRAKPDSATAQRTARSSS